MVAAVGALRDRQAAELARPHHDRRVEQAAAASGRAPGAALGWSVMAHRLLQALGVLAVRVPRLAAEEDLHEAHAALDEPAGQQAALAVLAPTSGCRCRRASASPRVSFDRSSTSGTAVCIRAASLVVGRAAPPARRCPGGGGGGPRFSSFEEVELVPRGPSAGTSARRGEVSDRRAAARGTASPGRPPAGSRTTSCSVPSTGRPPGSERTT